MRAEARAKYRRSDPQQVPDDLTSAPGRLLTVAQAAAYVGMSRNTLGLLGRQGKIPIVYLGNRKPRCLLSDLDEFIAKRQSRIITWDITARELPLAVVCRLLELTDWAVWTAAQTGRCPDLTPSSIRRMIERQLAAKLVTVIQGKYRKKFLSTMRNQRAELKKLRRQLKNSICPRCDKSMYVKPDRSDYWSGA